MDYGLLRVFRISWPVGLAALPFGAVYCLLVCLFPDSIDAYAKMHAYTDFSTWGGIEVLFMLNSAVLGWVAVVVTVRRTGVAGFVLILIALPWCLASIGSGFAVAWLCVGSISDGVWPMLAYSLGSVVCASALRTYMHEMS